MTEKEDRPGQEARDTVPPPSAGSTPQKTITRSSSSRMFAGVCGGLGEYFGVDPLLFRLAFAGLTLFAGAGIALYLAAWLLVPERDAERSIGEVVLGRARLYMEDRDSSWVWITLLVVGGLVILLNLATMGWRGAWFWGLLLIGSGIFLYQQDTRAGDGTGAPPAATTAAWHASSAPGSGAAAAVSRPNPKETWSRPVSKTQTSQLGRYTVAVTLMALGLVAMLDNAGTLEVGVAGYAALAMTVVGAGLLVGALWGRSRGLVLWGLLLLPLMLIGNNISIPVSAGVGERVFVPANASELAAEHRLLAGNMTFDLSRMEWGSGPVEIDASVFVGQLEIRVPDGVTVDFSGSAQMGQVELFERTADGTNVDIITVVGSGNGPTLVVKAGVFLGQITVASTRTPAKEVP